MAWLARASRRVSLWFFPARASTQTWMILTFVLFIGVAVVAVGLYVTFVVRSDIDLTIRQTLYRQVILLAEQIEQAETPDGRMGRARDIARFTDLRLTVVFDDTTWVDVQGARVYSDGDLFLRPEMMALAPGDVKYARRNESGHPMRFAAVRRLDSDYVLRVGQTEPALIALVYRLQMMLIASMVLALILAIIGSWIAAQRITEPLQSIRNSARNISEGHFDETITVDSRAAEFQDLASSLNRMSDTFRVKIGDLQRMAKLQNEFIGNVSHEVRNPIFAVGGYLEALGSSTLTDKQRRFYAEKGLSNLERLNNLFNDLIEIARLEYREDLLKTSVFDLQDLVEEVGEMLRAKADEKGLELLSDNPQVFVRADRNRIRQVLVNLVDNAIAYSDEGTVRCRFRRHLEKVRVEVVDTGRGIPSEHIDRVFERFYRVDPDRSRKSGGTGLGLSIVKQILQAHGEPIHVESTAGRSTRFWFELPFEDPALDVA